MAINAAKACIFLACALTLIQQTPANAEEHSVCKRNSPAEPIEARIPGSRIFIIPSWNVAKALDMLHGRDFALLGASNFEQLVGVSGDSGDAKYYLVKFISADSMQASNVGSFWQRDGKLVLYYFSLESGQSLHRGGVLILMLDRPPRSVEVYCLSAQ